jgi:hypothetical protein
VPTKTYLLIPILFQNSLLSAIMTLQLETYRMPVVVFEWMSMHEESNNDCCDGECLPHSRCADRVSSIFKVRAVEW